MIDAFPMIISSNISMRNSERIFTLINILNNSRESFLAPRSTSAGYSQSYENSPNDLFNPLLHKNNITKSIPSNFHLIKNSFVFSMNLRRVDEFVRILLKLSLPADHPPTAMSNFIDGFDCFRLCNRRYNG